MINENYKIISEALYKKHTQKQTILVLGFMVLFSGVIIYRIYKIAEEKIAENSVLIKRNDNLNFVNADLDQTNRILNAQVLYYIEQIASIAADKKKEATSETGKVTTENNQA